MGVLQQNGVLRRVLRRGSEKGVSRRCLERPLGEYASLGVRPRKSHQMSRKVPLQINQELSATVSRGWCDNSCNTAVMRDTFLSCCAARLKSSFSLENVILSWIFQISDRNLDIVIFGIDTYHQFKC